MAYPERIIPDETKPGVVALHLKRYDFARPLCAGNAVLDAACGVGYGSAFLAESAARVVGIDVSEESIAYATRRYGGPRTEFAVMDVCDLAFPDGSFDVVCSFETIEHVDDPERAVAEAARVLRPAGTFVVSTPHVAQTTRSPANPFHQVELSRADFEALLRTGFAEVELYGQRRRQSGAHRLAQRLDVLGLRRRIGVLRHGARLLGTAPTEALGLDDVVIEREAVEGATELIAVCRRA